MSSTPVPSKSDRTALWVAIVLGVGAAVVTVVNAVTRIVQIAPNRDVPVPAAFADSVATMPIGPGGAEVEVVPTQVVITVSDMPPITLWSLILAEVFYALVVGIGWSLGALTAAFQIGHKLQREAEGLV